MLVKSIAYLVHNDFAPEKLKEWTDALAKTSGPGAVGEEIAIVTHGFYTLLLKYPGEDIKNSVLRAKMTEWLDEAKFCLARPLLNAPNLSVWSRGAYFTYSERSTSMIQSISLTDNLNLELFKPERGFSPQLRKFHNSSLQSKTRTSGSDVSFFIRLRSLWFRGMVNPQQSTHSIQ
jgi:hypothetical protein